LIIVASESHLALFLPVAIAANDNLVVSTQLLSPQDLNGATASIDVCTPQVYVNDSNMGLQVFLQDSGPDGWPWLDRLLKREW
jgi:hypothetical protein